MQLVEIITNKIIKTFFNILCTMYNPLSYIKVKLLGLNTRFDWEEHLHIVHFYKVYRALHLRCSLTVDLTVIKIVESGNLLKDVLTLRRQVKL